MLWEAEGARSTLDLTSLFEFRRRCVQLGASVPVFVASYYDEMLRDLTLADGGERVEHWK